MLFYNENSTLTPHEFTRNIYRQTVWHYKLTGTEDWVEFPRNSGAITALEFIAQNSYSYSVKFEGYVGCTWNDFEPFITYQESGIGERVWFDEKNNTISIKEINVTMDVKRTKRGYVSEEREKIDAEDNPPFTRKEKKLMQISGTIREKPNWEKKYTNPDIVQKWHDELVGKYVSEEGFDYVVKELSYYESLQDGLMKPSSVQGVWQADELISEELRLALLQEVAKLENVPEKDKDWHPGSNKQVLDLVHPSLFCLVAGVSLYSHPCSAPFKNIGGGQTMSDNFQYPPEALKMEKEIKTLDKIISGLYKKKRKYDDEQQHKQKYTTRLPQVEHEWNRKYLYLEYTKSKNFQWLPADCKVDQNGETSFLSYINNLDPRTNGPLYKILSKILTNFIPLYDKVLTDLRNPRPRRYIPDTWSHEINPHDMYDITYPSLPPLPPFSPPPSLAHPVSLNGRRIQVIVKLANIILTPENPEYKGGVWHVEGMLNEQIISSGIYYYHSENITESRLHFRVAIVDPDYGQYDYKGVHIVYDLTDECEMNQEIGSVITKTGRCIAFPNLYQHRVAPFRLADPSKNGIRKILVYFLVDPAVYVTSTLTVPPQQPSWRKDTLAKYKPFNTLPQQILDLIFDYAATMTLEDAKKHREGLMQERKFIIQENPKNIFERPFSMCEH